jgi:hypothetical protein
MKEVKTIKSVDLNTGLGKNGKPYKRWVFEFEDGLILSTFNEKIGETFKPPQTVEIETEQKGKYKELLSMVLTEKNSDKQKTTNRERSIISQTLTKAWANTRIGHETKAKEVLEAYKYFLENL